MVYIKKVLFLIIIVFITSCTTNNKNITNKQPLWYLNSPNNTSDYIYGVAQSFDLEDAKLLALSDMGNKLIVNIDSSFTSKTFISSNYYKKDLEKVVKLKSKQLVFNNYKIKKIKKIGGIFYILLELNKKELYKRYKTKFELLHNSIKIKYNNSKIYSKLEKIYILQKLEDEIFKAKENLSILSAINSKLKYDKYLNFYEKIKIDIFKLKKDLLIYINSNNSNFKNQFISLLTKNLYKIYKNKKGSDIQIKIVVNNLKSQVYGWYISKTTSVINIEKNNKILSSYTILSSGRSSIDFKNSIIKSSINFKNKLKVLGLSSILF